MDFDWSEWERRNFVTSEEEMVCPTCKQLFGHNREMHDQARLAR